MKSSVRVKIHKLGGDRAANAARAVGAATAANVRQAFGKRTVGEQRANGRRSAGEQRTRGNRAAGERQESGERAASAQGRAGSTFVALIPPSPSVSRETSVPIPRSAHNIRRAAPAPRGPDPRASNEDSDGKFSPDLDVCRPGRGSVGMLRPASCLVTMSPVPPEVPRLPKAERKRPNPVKTCHSNGTTMHGAPARRPAPRGARPGRPALRGGAVPGVGRLANLGAKGQR